MRPEDRDLAYLWDMREAALDVMEFTKGIKYARFCSDKMLRYAVERRIEVIGEAAGHISEAFRAKQPEIPWPQIIGQRNILAHEYGEILIERIWRTAKFLN
jgi:uncharacterized protein with HEPN domain